MHEVSDPYVGQDGPRLFRGVSTQARARPGLARMQLNDMKVDARLCRRLIQPGQHAAGPACRNKA